jgi:hypothetical protein
LPKARTLDHRQRDAVALAAASNAVTAFMLATERLRWFLA